ncbi:MAG: response regulator [Acidobacteriia bacterium]|nr:response regulator [Terriglobia bacterium]
MPELIDTIDNAVLVVEPEPGMRGLLSRWLEDRGYQVTGASSAPEALAAMSRTRPEIAVCDATIDRQIGDGQTSPSFMQDLHAFSPRTKVVTIAGRRDLRVKETSLQHGAVDCLFQPLVADRLIAAIERARSSPRLGPAPPDAPVTDRRAAVRHDRCGLPAARLRSGQALTLLNLSKGGLLAESGIRLLPGTAQEVTLVGDDGTKSMLRALVLRCQVSYLDADRLRFRAALSFLEPCSWSPATATLTR